MIWNLIHVVVVVRKTTYKDLKKKNSFSKITKKRLKTNLEERKNLFQVYGNLYFITFYINKILCNIYITDILCTGIYW